MFQETVKCAKIQETNHDNSGPASKGEGDGLLHLNDDGLLLLVHVGSLSELDVAGPDVASGGELDALLGAADHHRLAELREVPVQRRVLHCRKMQA